MPLILRRHVDYGNGAGPKPKAVPPVPKPKKPFRYVSRDESSPANVFAWLMTFIESGERAPSLEQTILKFGNRGIGVVTDLITMGLISVEMFAGNYRVIVIDGRRTKGAPEHLQPCSFRDRTGEYKRMAGGWEKVG